MANDLSAQASGDSKDSQESHVKSGDCFKYEPHSDVGHRLYDDALTGAKIGMLGAKVSAMAKGDAKEDKNLPPVSIDGTTASGKVKLSTNQEIIDNARQHFDAFDSNSDAFLSEKELAKQVENPNNKGQLAQTIAALYGLSSKLNLSADKDAAVGWYAGISRNDLDKAEEVIKERQKTAGENPYSAGFLESEDKDSNGKLSLEELKEMSQGNLPEDVKVLVDFFIKNHDPLDEVEITDVLHHYASNKYGDKQDVLLAKMDFLTRKCWENQVEPARLFADEKPNGGVSMYGVQQGIMGDCYFESQLAVIAERSPETIKQMIKDNNDGTFTVTFPGAKDEPITVSAPTETELAVYNGSSEYGIWGSVLEKAYGAYCHKNFTRRTPLNLTGGLTTAEGADGGGVFSGKLMKLLTGESADVDWQWFTFNSTTKHKLMEHVGGESKVPVVAWQKFWKNSGQTTVSNHCYSVLDFDPKGDGGGTVTLYNPWGHKENLTFNQFTRRFLTVTYSDK